MALFAALASPPAVTFAQLNVTTRADVQYQYSSNIFDLSSGLSPPPGSGGTDRSDAFVGYGADLSSTYSWGRQNLTFDVGGRVIRYNQYSELNHDDYRLSADWQWHLGRSFDGSIAVNRNREMVPFSNFVGTSFIGSQLYLQTNQNEHATFNVQVGPDWRLETTGGQTHSDSPRPGFPNLTLVEDQGRVALRYVGQTGFSSGVSGGYFEGTYEGGLATGYHEQDAQFFASLSSRPGNALEFAMGYSRRQSANDFDQISGLTGNLSYQHALTGKTSIKVALTRSINSYITNAGSEIDTVGSMGLTWQATRKISVTALYSYTYSDLPRQGLSNADRLDHFMTTGFDVNYRITPYLQLQPYAHFETRTSDVFGAQYSSNIYGLYFYLTWDAVRGR